MLTPHGSAAFLALALTHVVNNARPHRMDSTGLLSKEQAERLLSAQADADRKKSLSIEDQILSELKSSMSAKRVGAIVGYGTCSATLLVINKLAVSQVPAPSFILACQLISSVATVLALGAVGAIQRGELEPIVWPKAQKFLPISLLFFLCLYTNVKSLEFANVDTVIVFRACSPIAVVIADWCVRPGGGRGEARCARDDVTRARARTRTRDQDQEQQSWPAQPRLEATHRLLLCFSQVLPRSGIAVSARVAFASGDRAWSGLVCSDGHIIGRVVVRVAMHLFLLHRH